MPGFIRHFNILIYIIFVLISFRTYAQVDRGAGTSNQRRTLILKETAIINDESVVLKDVDSGLVSGLAYPTYENLGSISYFEDRKFKRKIDKYESIARLDPRELQHANVPYSIEQLSAGEAYELDKYLEEYIRNFGIENFRMDSKYLSLAASLKEHQSDTSMALYYYSLLYKHHPQGLTMAKMARDSLLEPYHVEWISVDKYLDLANVLSKIDTQLRPPRIVESMGAQINSEHPEYAPYTHASDQILIFTSRREIKDLADPFMHKNEDLFISYSIFRDGVMVWDTAQQFNETINSKFNEGSACLSPDGNSLYFTRCGDNTNGYGDCDIYQSKRIGDNQWGEVKNLGQAVNSVYWESQPHISPDGKVLFFTSNRRGGFGGTDLYFSLYDHKSDQWGPAFNMGPVINTSQNEVTPYFHKINQTLYFSSTGQLTSFGGYDIYKSRRLNQLWNNTNNTWEEPHNLGPLINTLGNEYYFAIDGKGETIFFSRSDGKKNHLEQNFDLFSFPMPMEARPDAITTLKGYLIDEETGKPLVGTVMLLDLDREIEIQPKKANDRGYFEFDIVKNNRYRIVVMGPNYLTIKKDLDVKSDTTFKIFIESFEQNKPLVFESLEFSSNSYKMRSNIKPQLDELVDFLTNYAMLKLVVEGHTDSDGDENDNKVLSERRARNISEYLMAKGGFEPGRIIAKGYGESRPLVPNDTEAHKKQNRRVEFKLILDKNYDGEGMLPTEEELHFKQKQDISNEENISKDPEG